MDNLAHALTSCTIGAAIAPEAVKKRPAAFLLLSSLIVNLPDIDALLNFVSIEFYHFHHRGLTHSLFGLLAIVPLAYWLYSLLLSAKVPRKEIVSAKRLWVLAAAQIILGHYLLDLFTTYGMMVFYPLSKLRVAVPLMFIIDPVFWLIGVAATSSLIFARRRGVQQLRRVAHIAIVVVFCWWATLFSFKWQSVEAFSVTRPEVALIDAYPGPAAPLLWVVLGQENDRYVQMIKPFFTGATEDLATQEPWQYKDRLCPKMEDDRLAAYSFGEYLQWAEYAICFDQAEKCLCTGLKYSLLKWPEDPSFARFEFIRGQQGCFVPTEISTTYLQHMLSLLGIEYADDSDSKNDK